MACVILLMHQCGPNLITTLGYRAPSAPFGGPWNLIKTTALQNSLIPLLISLVVSFRSLLNTRNRQNVLNFISTPNCNLACSVEVILDLFVIRLGFIYGKFLNLSFLISNKGIL